MECLSQKKFNKDKLTFGGKVHANIQDASSNYEQIDMLDEINFACEDPTLILDGSTKTCQLKRLRKAGGFAAKLLGLESINLKVTKFTV